MYIHKNIGEKGIEAAEVSFSTDREEMMEYHVLNKQIFLFVFLETEFLCFVLEAVLELAL